MLTGPRLRQVALVAHDCGRVTAELSRAFGWARPFCDPGVEQFGLANAVFAVGDTFAEVVAPVRPDTTAGRYLERRGGDGGYMAIFQVPDLAAARHRLAGLGVRVVWRPGPGGPRRGNHRGYHRWAGRPGALDDRRDPLLRQRGQRGRTT